MSPEPEDVLLAIGRTTVRSKLPDARRQCHAQSPTNILHVSTNVSVYSGIPRLIRRWMQQDAGRAHSLALTKQPPAPVPKVLNETVLSTGGEVFVLNTVRGGLVRRADHLRRIASIFDLVVLHVWEQDVRPLIAFAQRQQLRLSFM